MSLARIQDVADDLLSSSQRLAASDRWAPALVLAFCAVDTCASLVRKPNHPWVQREDFIDWIASYLLPQSEGLPCTAEDLYAARCGLVHAYSSEARRRVEGHARELIYVLPKGSASHLLARPGTVSAVYVEAGALVEAVRAGVEGFLQTLNSDSAVRQLAEGRATELLQFCDDV